jgi:two-component system response regulator FixJ
MSSRERVYIVDDDAAVCDALSELFGAAGYEVAAFLSAEQFLPDCQCAECACAIVDLRLPEMNGLELQRQLRQRGVYLPCVFLTGNGDVPAAVEAMKGGAVSFLEKPCRPVLLLAAVREALERSRTQQARALSKTRLENLMRQLTDQERAVFHAVTRGLTNPQIANQLDVSPRTVQFRRRSLMAKLGVRTRAELVALATSALPADSAAGA